MTWTPILDKHLQARGLTKATTNSRAKQQMHGAWEVAYG